MDDRAPIAGLDEIPTPEQMVAENRLYERELQQSPDYDAAGEAIAARIIDASEYLVDQLQAFEGRLEQQLERFVLAGGKFHVEPEPPPDPVLLDPRYEQLRAILGDARAYEQVQALQNDELDEGRAPEPVAAGKVIQDDGETITAMMYDDSAEGRLARVRDILAPGAVLEANLVDQWTALEAEEDRHSVAGETVSGFELLYPAIVAAARRQSGRMTLEQFLDPAAIKACKAPWDTDPNPTAIEDATLETEIAQMMAVIERANHPNCQVQPRVVQKNDDGSTSIETIVGYHRRVSQVYRQLQQLTAMGAT